MTDPKDMSDPKNWKSGLGAWLPPSTPGGFLGLDRSKWEKFMTDHPVSSGVGTLDPPMPTNCIVCNHHNPYVGKEHLADDGHYYVCRTCKPGYERRRNLTKLAKEAERLRKKREEFG